MAAVTPSSTALPSGYHAPLALADANHHGSWLIICNAFGLLVVLICLAIRTYIRTRVSPPFGKDDFTLTAATGLAIIQGIVVFAGVHDGFGTSVDLISKAKLGKVEKLGYTADILYVVTLYVSKCAVALLFKRISPDRSHNLVASTILATCGVFALASILLVAVRCDVLHPWSLKSEQCRSSLKAAFAAIAAFDIVTELALFSMSIHLVWKLQTPLARKGRVVLAFGLRLPVVALAALRLSYIDQEISSSNPTLVGVAAAILTQVEIFYGIMAATIPCLRPFLAGFATNYGAMGGHTVMGGSQIGTSRERTIKNTKSSFVLASLASRNEMSATRPGDCDPDERMFRPNRTGNQASVVHSHKPRGNDASSIGSNESTKMIIKKDVTWQITEDSRSNSALDMYGGATSSGSRR